MIETTNRQPGMTYNAPEAAIQLIIDSAV